MKKYIFIFTTMAALIAIDAHAACTVSTTTYSCFAGYYLSGTTCVRCPAIGKNSSGTTVYGSTPDKNTGGKTTCYAPAGTYTDDTGTFTFSAQCNYTN